MGHNVVIFDGPDDTAPVALRAARLVTGPGTADYRIAALAPGDYFFHCEVHPAPR